VQLFAFRLLTVFGPASSTVLARYPKGRSSTLD